MITMHSNGREVYMLSVEANTIAREALAGGWAAASVYSQNNGDGRYSYVVAFTRCGARFQWYNRAEYEADKYMVNIM